MVEVEINGVTARVFRTNYGFMVTETHGATELVFAESFTPDATLFHFQTLLDTLASK